MDEQDGDTDLEDDDAREVACIERDSDWALSQIAPRYETEDDEDGTTGKACGSVERTSERSVCIIAPPPTALGTAVIAFG